jgi:mono/diheme cytochrome c family protein
MPEVRHELVDEARMKRSTKIGLVIGAVVFGIPMLAVVLMLRNGFSARDEPTAIETFAARRLRRFAIPSAARDAKSPIPFTPEVLADARAHFADHCATCHANDGSGNTEIGRNLYPPTPDMREASTQSLTDGELFYIIHNGIRFTGMPAWGDKDVAHDQDSWKLVHFIRHLPSLTADELAEMKSMNPKGPHEMEEEEEIRKFLAGEEADEPKHHH